MVKPLLNNFNLLHRQLSFHFCTLQERGNNNENNRSVSSIESCEVTSPATFPVTLYINSHAYLLTQILGILDTSSHLECDGLHYTYIYIHFILRNLFLRREEFEQY